MTKTVQKKNTLKSHFGQMMIILIFLLSISLSYLMGMLYQKNIDVRYFNMQKNKYEEQIQQQTEQASKEAMMKDIANWKKYTNKKFGFEIKYPNDSTTPKETINNKTTSISFNNATLSLNITAINSASESAVSDMKNTEVIKIQGKDIKKVTTQLGSIYTVTQKNNLYTFTNNTKDIETMKKNEQIISTLVFVDDVVIEKTPSPTTSK